MHAFQDHSNQVLKAAFDISNVLGCGFLEKVYENALVVELREGGLQIAQQVPFDVRYRGFPVGHYVADLVVADRLVVEIKAGRAQDPLHEAQCLNYLKASGLEACVLRNFGRPRVSFRRLVLTHPLSL